MVAFFRNLSSVTFLLVFCLLQDVEYALLLLAPGLLVLGVIASSSSGEAPSSERLSGYEGGERVVNLHN